MNLDCQKRKSILITAAIYEYLITVVLFVIKSNADTILLTILKRFNFWMNYQTYLTIIENISSLFRDAVILFYTKKYFKLSNSLNMIHVWDNGMLLYISIETKALWGMYELNIRYFWGLIIALLYSKQYRVHKTMGIELHSMNDATSVDDKSNVIAFNFVVKMSYMIKLCYELKSSMKWCLVGFM